MVIFLMKTYNQRKWEAFQACIWTRGRVRIYGKYGTKLRTSEPRIRLTASYKISVIEMERWLSAMNTPRCTEISTMIRRIATHRVQIWELNRRRSNDMLRKGYIDLDIFYSQLGCLTFSLRFWPKIEKLPRLRLDSDDSPFSLKRVKTNSKNKQLSGSSLQNLRHQPKMKNVVTYKKLCICIECPELSLSSGRIQEHRTHYTFYRDSKNIV